MHSEVYFVHRALCLHNGSMEDARPFIWSGYWSDGHPCSDCTLICTSTFANIMYQLHSIFTNSLVPTVQNYHCESFFAARPEILFEPPLRTEILFVEEGRRAPISNCFVNNAFTFPTSALFPGMCNLTIPVQFLLPCVVYAQMYCFVF